MGYIRCEWFPSQHENNGTRSTMERETQWNGKHGSSSEVPKTLSWSSPERMTRSQVRWTLSWNTSTRPQQTSIPPPVLLYLLTLENMDPLRGVSKCVTTRGLSGSSSPVKESRPPWILVCSYPINGSHLTRDPTVTPRIQPTSSFDYTDGREGKTLGLPVPPVSVHTSSGCGCPHSR